MGDNGRQHRATKNGSADTPTRLKKGYRLGCFAPLRFVRCAVRFGRRTFRRRGFYVSGVGPAHVSGAAERFAWAVHHFLSGRARGWGLAAPEHVFGVFACSCSLNACSLNAVFGP